MTSVFATTRASITFLLALFRVRSAQVSGHGETGRKELIRQFVQGIELDGERNRAVMRIKKFPAPFGAGNFVGSGGT
jgi:hypothetical protein